MNVTLNLLDKANAKGRRSAVFIGYNVSNLKLIVDGYRFIDGVLLVCFAAIGDLFGFVPEIGLAWHVDLGSIFSAISAR